MSDGSQRFRIDGMEELVRALRGLPVQLEREIIERYLRDASNRYGVGPLKSGLPYSPRTLAAIKATKDRTREQAYFSGPTTDAFWLRFVDKGTKVRKTKSGANRGRIVGKFRVPGIVNAQVRQIVDEAAGDLGKEIESYMNKNKGGK